MRVLVVSQHFWPEGFRINDLVKSLKNKNINVDVLTGKPNYPEGAIFVGYRAWGIQREQWGGITIYRIPLRPRGKKGALGLFLNYLSFIVSGLIAAPWTLRGNRYDAIFVYATSPILQAIPAIFLGWLKKCGVVVWVQDLWPDSLVATGYIRNPAVLRLVDWVVRLIYRHTDLLLVQSRAFEQIVSTKATGKRVVYYPNSAENLFSAPPAVTLPDIAALHDGFPVVFAGNVGAGQAVEVIVEAAALLKNHPAIRFVVFGNGSRWDWMRQQVERRGLTNLHLPGRFPMETMPGLMQQAAALLVTLADQPIFAATIPSKVQAYMAAGRPILACLNGEGARLVAEANAGLAVPAENPQALANAVLQLFEMSPEAREMLGTNARAYFKTHFDQDRLTSDLIEHFRTLAVS